MALWLGGPQEINGWAGPQRQGWAPGNHMAGRLGGNQWLGHRESMARPQAKNGGQWAMARWAWLAAWLGGPRSQWPGPGNDSICMTA